ncbi:MAG TPA: hypothetical protein VFL34_19560 [Candidatus Sulfotelmatobacter sp.]|nr:hypothetical protein [Candidatus Sulfotelmatobacter sp.]
MTASTPVQDLAAQWKSARRLYPIYYELAREFAIDVKPCSDLESGVETPSKEAVAQANRWLDDLDQNIQVHQMRQFLQTSSQVNQDALLSLVHRFLAKTVKTDIMRDKVDFLLVQYFSQLAPVGVADAEVDLSYVAQALEPILGEVELKPPVWLNALDRVLESARRCRSLDELLHGGILEQGRKAKGLAGDLFYLPVALVAFTRFGYLMRRTFFRLMLADLNTILEGLTELEEAGVTAIDCRRAQFSAQEPIVRLRVICQSWKVMFQAEYSSGSPLRMLVDLRASVDQALGRGKPVEPEVKRDAEAKSANAGKTAVRLPASRKPGIAAAKPVAAAAAAGIASKPLGKPATPPAPGGKPNAKPAVAKSVAPEFEISGTPGWEPDSEA